MGQPKEHIYSKLRFIETNENQEFTSLHQLEMLSTLHIYTE